MEERVASVGALADGQMMAVVADGKKTLLARVNGNFYATAARCPHWGGDLPKGLLVGSHVLCPLHQSTFEVGNGALLEPPSLDGLRTFRVRVDGDDVYVDRSLPAAGLEAAAPCPPPTADSRVFAVIGAGAAALAAAQTLREECFGGRIVLISPEDRWPYDRPNLSKDYLAGKLEASWLPLRPPKWYEDHGVERIVGRVVALDVVERRLTLDDDTTLTPDAVLVASGTRPRTLALSGAELGNIFTLRTWDDAEQLTSAAQEGRRVVVIGASFIGMEGAAGLRQRGLEVTVVGPEQIPFELVLGAPVGQVVKAVHDANGTQFALGHAVARFLGDEVVRGVELDDGTRLDADLVVVGIGVQPDTDYVQGVERDRDGGLPVDGQLRVAPGVWAAGDVARYPEPYVGRDVRIEHWRLAEQHGRAAARAMLGRDEEFRGVPFFWTQHWDLELGYAGSGRGWQELIVCGDPVVRDFTAFYAADDRLLAACGTQSDELSAFIELMAAGRLPSAAALRGHTKAGLPELLGQGA